MTDDHSGDFGGKPEGTPKRGAAAAAAAAEREAKAMAGPPEDKAVRQAPSTKGAAAPQSSPSPSP